MRRGIGERLESFDKSEKRLNKEVDRSQIDKAIAI